MPHSLKQRRQWSYAGIFHFETTELKHLPLSTTVVDVINVWNTGKASCSTIWLKVIPKEKDKVCSLQVTSFTVKPARLHERSSCPCPELAGAQEKPPWTWEWRCSIHETCFSTVTPGVSGFFWPKTPGLVAQLWLVDGSLRNWFPLTFSKVTFNLFWLGSSGFGYRRLIEKLEPGTESLPSSFLRSLGYILSKPNIPIFLALAFSSSKSFRPGSPGASHIPSVASQGCGPRVPGSSTAPQASAWSCVDPPSGFWSEKNRESPVERNWSVIRRQEAVLAAENDEKEDQISP